VHGQLFKIVDATDHSFGDACSDCVCGETNSTIRPGKGIVFVRSFFERIFLVGVPGIYVWHAVTVLVHDSRVPSGCNLIFKGTENEKNETRNYHWDFPIDAFH
jgi:hypothetical protein